MTTLLYIIPAFHSEIFLINLRQSWRWYLFSFCCQIHFVNKLERFTVTPYKVTRIIGKLNHIWQLVVVNQLVALYSEVYS